MANLKSLTTISENAPAITKALLKNVGCHQLTNESHKWLQEVSVYLKVLTHTANHIFCSEQKNKIH